MIRQSSSYYFFLMLSCRSVGFVSSFRRSVIRKEIVYGRSIGGMDYCSSADPWLFYQWHTPAKVGTLPAEKEE
jgi:hypothetical protein